MENEVVIDRKQIKLDAKSSISGKLANVFMLGVVYAIITFLVSFFCGFIPFVGWIIVILVDAVFLLGWTQVWLKLARTNEQPEFADLFSYLQFDNAHFTKAVFLYIRIVAFTFLWSLLFIIPGIIKGIAYSFAPFIAIDYPELDARECQEKSIEMTQGYKGQLFILSLSFLGWILLGIITLGLAFIYVEPYYKVAFANFYRKVRGENNVVDITE
jgi:uncharacterized membrane protein